jgi:hypothetical protein
VRSSAEGFLLIAFADRGRWSATGVFRRTAARV